MSLSRYVLGLALLGAIVGASALGGLGLRRRLLPGWIGAPARLAETIGALALLIGVAELLGATGLLRMPLLLGGCLAGGWGLQRAARPAGIASEEPPRGSAVSPYAMALSIAALILVLGQWAATLAPTLHGGMTGPDTLGYHGPIAATFAQQGSIVHPPFIYTDPAIAFFPATSELVHAVGILLFSRDVLSPFINLGWLALGALAAWCIGRPRGMAPASLLCGLVLLDVPAFSTSQPSSGDNDIMALALLMSCLALLISAEVVDQRGVRTAARSPAAVALAGLAAGLALATKVTMFAPVGLLVLVVTVVLRGWRTRFMWLAAVVAESGIWFLRNLFAFGNPFPAVRLGIGPLALPSARVPGSGSTVADYLFDGGIWRSLFLPGLHAGLTAAWPVILATAFAGAVAAVLGGSTRLDRLLGLVTLLSTMAYAMTPRTGFPFLVAINLRYLGPALAFGLVVVFRLHGSNLWRRPSVAVLLCAGVLVDLADPGDGAKVLGFAQLGPAPHFLGTTTMWFAVVLAGAAAWLVIHRRVNAPRRPATLLALLVLLVTGLAMWPAERTYLRTRYVTGPLAFARSLHHRRIAVVGFIEPYPAFGLDLSNSVTEISHHGPHGAQTLVRSCSEWRRILTQGRYDYVITSPPYALIFRSAPDYAAWTRSDPAASVIDVSPTGIGGTVSVFELHGPLDPSLCS